MFESAKVNTTPKLRTVYNHYKWGLILYVHSTTFFILGTVFSDPSYSSQYSVGVVFLCDYLLGRIKYFLNRQYNQDRLCCPVLKHMTRVRKVAVTKAVRFPLEDLEFQRSLHRMRSLMMIF